MASDDGMRDEAERILRDLAGDRARLREDQWTAIEALVVGRRRVLCVQRTGWGKSAVYFIATTLLRHQGAGTSLIISPLLALMRNQIDAANRAGIAARTINSDNLPDWYNVYDEILENKTDALLVSPERLNNLDFREYILPKLAAITGLVVVDEAHCISDWGHDFRPDYRRIRTLLEGLAPGTPVLATTATANARVTKDVSEQLGDTLVIRGPLDRKSLRLSVLSLPTSAHRLAWLSQHLNELPGSGIIYALTRQSVKQTEAFLKAAGHNVVGYTSKTEGDDRLGAETDLINNKLKAVVATSALGMGFDKGDLGFVVHLGAPPSPIVYYQQIGRAGRAIDDAIVLLLPSDQDRRIWQDYTSLAFPPEEKVRSVLAELAASDQPTSVPSLETRVELSHGQLDYMLKVLDVDGAVRKVGGGWVATGLDWQHDTARYERVAAARAEEQKSIEHYNVLTGCRLEFLRRSLDDETAGPCGRCDNCAGQFLADDVSADALRLLNAHLDAVGTEISPRSRWPPGLRKIGISLAGAITASESALAGGAIARFTEIGWGERLRAILDDDAPDGEISSAVLTKATTAFDDCLRRQEITGIILLESHRRPVMMRTVAEALATHSGLPFLGTLERRTTAPANSPNSARRVAVLHDGFVVPPALLFACRDVQGAVVLVDDFVDSRWTMTLAARTLRLAGLPAVIPFALATTGRD